DDREAAGHEVARLHVALRVEVVDVEDERLFGVGHGAPWVASRRNSETFSREIVFFEITRVPAGMRALSSALTLSEVDKITGLTLVRLSTLSSCSTVKPSTVGICRSRMMTSGCSLRAMRRP